MNVTISLVTEFEDIPKELTHMLKFVEQELNIASKKALNTARKINDNVDNEEIMELLHAIRLHMAKIDVRMEDCMSVLGGYMHYLENPPEEIQEETEQEVEEENEEG